MFAVVLHLLTAKIRSPSCKLLTVHGKSNTEHNNSRNSDIRPATYSKTNSVALSPQANYTDRRPPLVDENLVPTFVDSGVSRGQRGGSPTVVNLSFL
jgi:hypothetical protein